MERQLLESLADLLESGELISVFNIKEFNEKHLGETLQTININGRVIRNCGTAQCAIGQLPILTNRAYFAGDGSLLLLVAKEQGMDYWKVATEKSIAAFFGISEPEIKHLFFAGEQNVEQYGGMELAKDSTPGQVAFNIREYLKTKIR